MRCSRSGIPIVVRAAVSVLQGLVVLFTFDFDPVGRLHYAYPAIHISLQPFVF